MLNWKAPFRSYGLFQQSQDCWRNIYPTWCSNKANMLHSTMLNDNGPTCCTLALFEYTFKINQLNKCTTQRILTNRGQIYSSIIYTLTACFDLQCGQQSCWETTSQLAWCTPLKTFLPFLLGQQNPASLIISTVHGKATELCSLIPMYATDWSTFILLQNITQDGK